MYSYEIWDKKSSINGVSAEEMLKAIPHSNENIYFIKVGEVVNLIVPNSLSQYEGETIEEKAQKHCEALNNPPQQESEVTE